MPDNTTTLTEVTGLRNDTPMNMQLDAGLFVTGFTPGDTVKTAEAFLSALQTFITTGTGLMGATRGGGTFVAQPTIREPEIDGKRGRVKNAMKADNWDIRLTGTLIEITPSNWKLVLPGADVAAPSATGDKHTKITLRTVFSGTDYIPKVSWISLLGDGTYMMITIENAINIDGTTLTFLDKNEGTLPFNFAATMAQLTGNTTLPFSIDYYAPSGNSGSSGSSGGSGGSGGSGESA